MSFILAILAAAFLWKIVFPVLMFGVIYIIWGAGRLLHVWR